MTEKQETNYVVTKTNQFQIINEINTFLSDSGIHIHKIMDNEKSHVFNVETQEWSTDTIDDELYTQLDFINGKAVSTSDSSVKFLPLFTPTTPLISLDFKHSNSRIHIFENDTLIIRDDMMEMYLNNYNDPMKVLVYKKEFTDVEHDFIMNQLFKHEILEKLRFSEKIITIQTVTIESFYGSDAVNIDQPNLVYQIFGNAHKAIELYITESGYVTDPFSLNMTFEDKVIPDSFVIDPWSGYRINIWTDIELFKREGAVDGIIRFQTVFSDESTSEIYKSLDDAVIDIYDTERD